MKLVRSLLIGVRNGKLSGQTSNIVLKNADENVRAGLYIGSLEKTRRGNLSKIRGSESYKPLSENTISTADDTSEKVLDSSMVIEPRLSSKQARQQWFRKKMIGNKGKRK